MSEPTPNSAWKHYKGSIYIVERIAQHTETNEKMVIYYDANMKTWCRPLTMWQQCVGIDENGFAIFRFVEVK